MINSVGKSASRGKVIRLPDQSPGAPVHRYRTPRAWSVAGLAAMAATGTVMLTGAVSVTLSDVDQRAQVCAGQAPAAAASHVQGEAAQRRDAAGQGCAR